MDFRLAGAVFEFHLYGTSRPGNGLHLTRAKVHKSAVIMRQKEVIYILFALLVCMAWKEGIFLFSDALNTFYLRLYASDIWLRTTRTVRGNPLPQLHGLLFFITSKSSFIFNFPQTG